MRVVSQECQSEALTLLMVNDKMHTTPTPDQLRIAIHKDREHYAVVVTADGCEPERFDLRQDEVDKLFNRAELIATFL